MDLSDTDLIIKAQNGDSAAFEDLVYRYDRRVLGIAFRFVNDREDAKDIYQEVFIRVFKSINKFQFKSEFSTWLYRITTNVCLTYKSRKKKTQHILIDEENEDGSSFDIISDDNENLPEEITTSNELKEIINSEIDKLSSKKKMIFILKHYEGYKIREIADMLKCKEGTVKKSLFDATQKLKSQLEYLVKE